MPQRTRPIEKKLTSYGSLKNTSAVCTCTNTSCGREGDEDISDNSDNDENHEATTETSETNESGQDTDYENNKKIHDKNRNRNYDVERGYVHDYHRKYERNRGHCKNDKCKIEKRDSKKDIPRESNYNKNIDNYVKNDENHLFRDKPNKYQPTFTNNTPYNFRSNDQKAKILLNSFIIGNYDEFMNYLSLSTILTYNGDSKIPYNGVFLGRTQINNFISSYSSNVITNKSFQGEMFSNSLGNKYVINVDLAQYFSPSKKEMTIKYWFTIHFDLPNWSNHPEQFEFSGVNRIDIHVEHEISDFFVKNIDLQNNLNNLNSLNNLNNEEPPRSPSQFLNQSESLCHCETDALINEGDS